MLSKYSHLKGIRTFRSAGLVIAAATIALGLVWARCYADAAREFRAAESSMQQGDQREAVLHYARSMRWRTPGSPYPEASARRLWDLGAKAEARGEAVLARRALETLRSAVLSGRGLRRPGNQWIERCDAHLTALGRGPSFKSYHPASLSALSLPPEGPSAAGSVLLIIGFVVWVGCAVGLASSEPQCDEKFSRLPTMYMQWKFPLIIFYVFWLIGLLLT